MALRFALIASLCVAVAYAAHPWEPEARDANWMKHHEQLLNQTKHHANEIQVVFFGDSITQGWGGNGKHVWQQHYQNRHSYNYGIGGDRTEHLLYRIAHGEFDGLEPKLIVMMIGTNNISHKNNAADTAKGIHAILDALHTKVPAAKVLLLSVLPRNTVALDTEVHDINKLIARFADHKRVHYLDLAVHFEVSLAHEKAELYVADHLHLAPKGYEMWYKVMEPSFKQLTA